MEDRTLNLFDGGKLETPEDIAFAESEIEKIQEAIVELETAIQKEIDAGQK